MPVTEAPSSGNGNWNGRLKTARQRQPRTLLVSLLEPVFEEDAVAAFPGNPWRTFFCGTTVGVQICSELRQRSGHCHSQFYPPHPHWSATSACNSRFLPSRQAGASAGQQPWMDSDPYVAALLRAGSFGAARLRMTRHGLRASGW